MKPFNDIKFVFSEFALALFYFGSLLKECSANVGFELKWQNFPESMKC